jgi:hypothetical protein
MAWVLLAGWGIVGLPSVSDSLSEFGSGRRR